MRFDKIPSCIVKGTNCRNEHFFHKSIFEKFKFNREMIYKYRVLKHTWGIWIDLDIDIIENRDNESIKVNNSISFKNNSNLNSDVINRYLMKAILDSYDNIKLKLNFKNNLLLIKHIEISNTDFQIEGIYAALMEAIYVYFEIENNKVDVYFDRKNSIYVYPDLVHFVDPD